MVNSFDLNELCEIDIDHLLFFLIERREKDRQDKEDKDRKDKEAASDGNNFSKHLKPKYYYFL